MGDIDLRRRLDGRIALVTGAAAGIGRAIAQRLAAEGAVVVVNDLSGDGCAAVAAELGGAALAAPGDISDPRATEAVVADVMAQRGRLDILVNNAGVLRDAPLHRMTDEDWRIVHDVVLRGTFNMCRSCAAVLRGERDALPAYHRKVVNISSSVGIHGAAGTVNYSAAKAGVIGLTRALAREWAPRRINVNAVAPGLVAGTALTDLKPAELIERTVAQIPIGRAGTPDDVAAAVAFLASPDSDYLTGQVLDLHGGLDVPS